MIVVNHLAKSDSCARPARRPADCGAATNQSETRNPYVAHSAAAAVMVMDSGRYIPEVEPVRRTWSFFFYFIGCQDEGAYLLVENAMLTKHYLVRSTEYIFFGWGGACTHDEWGCE